MDSHDERQSASSASRTRRALSLGAASILALATAGFTYLHPSWDFGMGALATTSRDIGSRHLGAVDFVSPVVGWVVVEHQSHDFVVLRTSDAGETWTRQLAGSDEAIGEYLHFFDASRGIVVVLGKRAALYRTGDGGNTWDQHPLTRAAGYVLSADFVDADHGWLLAHASTEGEALLRTDDGGTTWTGLGNPVAYSDWAYGIVFSDSRNGWLYSESTGPYAYNSQDAGVSWQRIALPGPPGGWPNVAGARLSVTARPTEGAGVIVTVVIGPSAGLPVSGSSSPRFDTQPVTQFRLRSGDGGRSWRVFSTPAAQGALNSWWPERVG